MSYDPQLTAETAADWQEHTAAIAAFLTDVWGQDNHGYVFVFPQAEGAEPSFRKHGWKWPMADPDALVERVRELMPEDHWGRAGLHFAPAVLPGRTRARAAEPVNQVFGMDLDAADPAEFPEALRPEWAWETSPGNWTGVWRYTGDDADTRLVPLSMRTAWGTDKGGHGRAHTQRVPGSWNVKRRHRDEESGTYPLVRLSTAEESRTWTGPVRDTADLLSALEEAYPAVIAGLSAAGVTGDRAVTPADMQHALSVVSEDEELTPTIERMLTNPDGDADPSSVRYRAVAEMTAQAWSLRQIVDAVSSSWLASSKSEQQIVDDVARIAAKRAERELTLSTQLRRKSGLTDDAPDATPEEAFGILCQGLRSKKDSTYIGAYLALAEDGGETWLARSLPDDFDPVETARQMWLPEVHRRRERDERREKREAAEAEKSARTWWLPDDAVLLDREGDGGVFLAEGEFVFSSGGKIDRRFFPGEIALCEEAVRVQDGREVVISRMAQVTREGLGTVYVPLVDDPRDPSFCGASLAGDAVFLPRTGDMQRVIRAARRLGQLRGTHRRIVVPAVYGTHQGASGAEIHIGARVVTAQGVWTTPDDLHIAAARNLTPADPDPQAATRFLALLLDAFEQHGAEYVAPIVGATLAGPILDSRGPWYLFGPRETGKTYLPRAFGVGLLSSTMVWGAGGAEVTVNASRTHGSTPKAIGTLAARLAGLPMTIDEAGAGHADEVAATSDLVHKVFDQAERYVSTPSGELETRTEPPRATALISSNFGLVDIAASRAVVIDMAQPLPGDKSRFESADAVRVKTSASAAYLVWLAGLMDARGGVDAARAEASQTHRDFLAQLPATGGGRHREIAAHALVGIHYLAAFFLAHGAQEEAVQRLREESWAGVASVLAAQADTMDDTPTDPVELVSGWVREHVRAGLGHVRALDTATGRPEAASEEEAQHGFGGGVVRNPVVAAREAAWGWSTDRPSGAQIAVANSSARAEELEESVYLFPEAVGALARRYAESGHVTAATLRTALVRAGLMHRGADGRARMRLRVGGRLVDVLPIPRAAIFGERDGGSEGEDEGGGGTPQPPQLPLPPVVPLPEAPALAGPVAVEAPAPAPAPAAVPDAPEPAPAAVPDAPAPAPAPVPARSGDRTEGVILVTPEPVWEDGTQVRGLSTPASVDDLVTLVQTVMAQPGPTTDIIVTAEGAAALGAEGLRPLLTKAGKRATSGQRLRKQEQRYSEAVAPVQEALGAQAPWWVMTGRPAEAGRRVVVQFAEMLAATSDGHAYGDGSTAAVAAFVADWARTGMPVPYQGVPTRTARALVSALGGWGRVGSVGDESVDTAWTEGLTMRGTGAQVHAPIPETAERLLAVDTNQAYLSKLARTPLPMGTPQEVADYDPRAKAAVWEIVIEDGHALPYVPAGTPVVVPAFAVTFLREDCGAEVEVRRGWIFPAESSAPFRKAAAHITDALGRCETEAVRATLKMLYQQLVGSLASAKVRDSAPGWYRPHWQTTLIWKAEVDTARKIRRVLGDDVSLAGFITDGALLAYTGAEPGLSYGTRPGTLRREADVEISQAMREATDLQTLRALVKEASDRG